LVTIKGKWCAATWFNIWLCYMPLERKDVGSILDFLWSGVNLWIWLLTFLLTITYVSDVQMGHASPFQTSSFQYLSNDINNSSRKWVLTLAVALWRFESPPRLRLPTWEFNWECECSFSHSPTLPGLSWPALLQTFALVASPRLRLWHMWCFFSHTQSQPPSSCLTLSTKTKNLNKYLMSKLNAKHKLSLKLFVYVDDKNLCYNMVEF
jgi:hypothetical protein